MFCPKCAKINPDSNDLCSNCGAVLHEIDSSASVKKTSSFKAIVAILLVIALIVAIVLLLNGCTPDGIDQDSISF